MSTQQQAAWPEGVIARYLTVGGALVDISHDALYVDDAKPNMTLARCGGAGCGSYNNEEWGRADRFNNGSGAADSAAREWAQAHAEKCRALPKPGGRPMSAPIPGAGLAAIGATDLLDEDGRRQVSDWAGQVATVSAEEIVAVIDDAVDLIAKHGWVQRQYGFPETGFSLVGAVEWDAYLSDWEQQRRGPAERAAVKCLRICIALRGGTSTERQFISAWNDHPRRTPEEVTALLAEARELAWRIGGR